MPSPVAHGLAGLSVVWSLEGLRLLSSLSPATKRRLLATCLLFAMVPDVDLLFTVHRGPTHSVGAALIAAVLAGGVAFWLRLPFVPIAVACGLAYGSHVLLDWLGEDTSTPSGLMGLWPWRSTYYRSGLDIFEGISRRYWLPEQFLAQNLKAVGLELAVVLPVAALAYWLRRRVSSG